MDDKQMVEQLGVTVTDACIDQVTDHMTHVKPGTEEFGSCCEQLNQLTDVRNKQKDDMRKDEQLKLEKTQKKSDRKFRIFESIGGIASMVLVTLGTTAFKGWLDNRELIVGREIDEAEKEAKRESFKFFQKKI